jgi:regulator of protease activity HflC (stomatin/prohibitin superfamily)
MAMPNVSTNWNQAKGRRTQGDPPHLNVVSLILFLACFLPGLGSAFLLGNPAGVIAGTVLGLIAALAPKVAQQWERAVVLRLGNYSGLRGPGLFWAAQTALRDIIGRTPLTVLLRGREQIEAQLQKLIDERSNPWGVTVQSVEMRDVIIPEALQDAMSREAQAAREKEARIILGQAEVEIAHLFEQASKSYEANPTALHLRAMNILYEGLKEKGALMLIPSTAVESMGLGGLLGAAALRQQALAQEPTPAAQANGPVL